MKKRGIGQRIAFSVALLSYLSAMICVASFFHYRAELGGDDPIVASLGSTTVFLIGVGVVLHVIGKANLPSLSLNSGRDDGERNNENS